MSFVILQEEVCTFTAGLQNVNKTGDVRVNVTFRRVRVTSVAVEKQ
jgi:hypothetical protein